MSLVKSFMWNLIYPFVRNYYSLHIAVTPEEKEKVYRFRYEIYRKQLNHSFWDKKSSEKGLLHDEYDDQDNSLIICATRNNKVVGTIRLTVWKNNDLPEDIQQNILLVMIFSKSLIISANFAF